MSSHLPYASATGLKGVIWITGFSAAGKTTIGRKVEARLRAEGLSTVFLDGDDLRSIFGAHWGYEREERIDLARVYFRLCSHLAAQGITVVISAVAMYEEVFDWVRTNIPRNIQVYLKVPEEERRRRDEQTKNIYTGATNFATMYDEPSSPDLAVENYGEAEPDEIAARIVDVFRKSVPVDRDMGRARHWREFYSKAHVPSDPSPFAESVACLFSGPTRILEIGCGNGRDAVYFATHGHSVTALDLSEAAIEKCEQEHGHMGIEFIVGKLGDLTHCLGSRFDSVYARFVLHAMSLEEEIETLRAAFSALRPGGRFHIECRSINDPLSRQGDVISPTERIHGHYRRFVIHDELVARLEASGFEILNSLESDGLAVFGDDDPVVIRASARRPV